jgi:hypothetical protein
MNDKLQEAINALREAGNEAGARAVEELRARMAATMDAYNAGQRASYENGLRDGALGGAPPDPLVWRFTGIAGLKPYMTDKQYAAQSPGVQKWYEPVCQKCAAAPAAPSLPESAPSNSGVQESVYLTSQERDDLPAALPKVTGRQLSLLTFALYRFTQAARDRANMAAQDKKAPSGEMMRAFFRDADDAEALLKLLAAREASAGEVPSNKTECESSAPKGAL